MFPRIRLLLDAEMGRPY